MSDGTTISWTDATWSPVTGCTKTSEGCTFCYIDRTPPFRMVHRKFDGNHIGATTGVKLHSERLHVPLSWRKPRRIFVCSLADLFQDEVPTAFIAEVFAVISLAPQHTFQVLTKRHARLKSVLNSETFWETVNAARAVRGHVALPAGTNTLPNAWIGVSVENQKWADIRIPALLQTPAAVRWISAEPLLGPVVLDSSWLDGPDGDNCTCSVSADCPMLRWVVVGGESGPGARPMHPQWARSLRDQCVGAGVAYHFKQWGEWGPAPWSVKACDPAVGWTGTDAELAEAKADAEARGATHAISYWADQYGWEPYKPSHKPWSLERTTLDETQHAPIRRWGKKVAGRELDGRTWDEYPTVPVAVSA